MPILDYCWLVKTLYKPEVVNVTTTYSMNKNVNIVITNWQPNWSLTRHVNTNNLSLCVWGFFLQQEKPKLIDPLDYETVISELGDDVKEDPLRDLLLFPDNDFSVSTRARVCVCVSVCLMVLHSASHT